MRVRTPFSAQGKSPEPQTAAPPASGLFYTTPRTRAGNRVQPRPSPPSFGGPGWILKGAGTLALISSPKTRNQCEFEPRFPLKGNPQNHRPQHTRRRSFLSVSKTQNICTLLTGLVLTRLRQFPAISIQAFLPCTLTGLLLGLFPRHILVVSLLQIIVRHD